MSAMFDLRLKQVKSLIRQQKLDAVFISTVSNITYLTGYANFSKEEREAYLIIGKNFQYIITDGRYSEAIKKNVPFFTLFERGYKNKTEDLLKNLKDKVKALGIEEDNLTVAEYKLIKKHYKNIKHFEINTRSIKNTEEIKKIEKACLIGDLAFAYILKKIKVGITEKQLAYELEYFIKQQGYDLSFPTIVAFSKNSSVPHHHTGDDKLEKKEGQFILLDFGVKYENYCSDMTRTVFFGEPTKKQQDIYQSVLDSQKQATEFLNSSIKSGLKIVAADVDQVARECLLSKGYPSIPHALGHGIGLEVHESPYISPKSEEQIEEGMVFSIEPGIYIEGFGGVRIEDLFVIEKNRIRQLTNSKKIQIVI
jgi:Xaa-Pro aminopeptidase